MSKIKENPMGFEINEKGGFIIPDGMDFRESSIKNFPQYCEFGDDCVFGKDSKFDDYCEFGDYCEFDSGCHFSYRSKFKRDCKFGERCTFENYITFGTECKFGQECVFEDENEFANGCVFANGCKFGKFDRFDRGCRFGDGCNFDFYNKFLNDYHSFGDGCNFSEWATFSNCHKFGKDCKIMGMAFEKLICLSNIDGSGRQIKIFFLSDGNVIINAGCFYGDLKEFLYKADSEGKKIYVNVIPAVIEAYFKSKKGK